MSKEKVLKILLIVVIIIFFLLGCFTIYKFVIINKIFNKMAEYVLIENYYMKIIDTDDESGTLEMYYKDGIGKLIMSNGIYTWTDGNEAYLIDDENKQVQTVSMDSSILVSNEAVGSMIPGYSRNLLEKFFLAGDLKTSVKVKDYEGIKYYMITTNEEEKKIIWFKYDTLLPSQANIEIGELKKSYNYEITFDKVQPEDIQKPNIEEYTVVE